MSTADPAVHDEREEDGRRCLEDGAWQDARRHFEAVVAARESASAYEGLGWAGWWLSDADLTFSSRETAYRLYRTTGNDTAAGRVATWLAADFREFRGEVAVGRGWLERAGRLLGDAPESVDHGWLALMEADFALNVDRDLEATSALASGAAELGRRLRSADLESVGLAVAGLALVARGELAPGMRNLDEAAVIALGEDLREPVASCWAVCCLVSACDAVGDFERASQSCKMLREVADRWGGRQIVGVCRTSYGRVLATRGDWADAETELQAAIADFEAARPGMAGAGLLRLAELRARQGKVEEAQALFTRCGPDGAVGLGEIALARGDAEMAVEYAERALRRLPEAARIDRLPALELLARARADLADEGGAAAAFAQLEQNAEPFPTPYVCGRVHLVRGHVAFAKGAAGPAREAFEDSIDCFAEGSAPYELALARLGLARALRMAGHADRAVAEAAAAGETFAMLGAARDVELAAGFAAGGGPPAQDGSGGSGRADGSLVTELGELTARELEVLRLVARGMSDVEIAAELVLSPHTVHRHVANIRVKLGLNSRAAAVAYAARQGAL